MYTLKSQLGCTTNSITFQSAVKKAYKSLLPVAAMLTFVNGDTFQRMDSSTDTEEKTPALDIQKTTNEKSQREVYLKITSYFPNLDSKYRQLLQKSMQEPDNERNNFVLSSFENILKMFSTSNQKLIYMKPYLEILDKKYSNCLDGIADNLASTVNNGNSPMHYMVLLHNEKISENDIYKWAKCKNLSCDEFMVVRNISDKALSRLNKLRETNRNFSITKCGVMHKIIDPQTYAIKLDFPTKTDLSVKEILQSVTDVHKAVYGSIYLKKDKKDNDPVILQDIKTDFIDNTAQGREISEIYNFVKYIEPSALRKFKYTYDEVDFLPKEDANLKKIKNICNQVIQNLNSDNPRLKEVLDVLNDKKLFDEIITTKHAKIRFLTRFVLKACPNPINLRDETQKNINILIDELRMNSTSCHYFCYRHSKGSAPQFYLSKSKLGRFLKITLNKDGYIHNLFNDFNKESELKDRKLYSM